MSTVGRNVVSNIATRVWSGVIGVIFVPLYVSMIGIESYGLVGVYSTLVALFAVLDMGLGPAVNRYLARSRVNEEEAVRARQLVRTLEIVYWTAAVVIGAFIVALASPIAFHWVKVDKLPQETVREAIVIMAVVFTCRWPQGLYDGGLQGLEQQHARNVILAVGNTVRSVGVLFVLRYVSPTIQTFFLWAAVVTALQTLAMAWTLARHLPQGGIRDAAPHPSGGLKAWLDVHTEHLRVVGRFAAGVTAISVLTSMLGQADKVILSGRLSLEQFGYYTMAGTVAGALYSLISPMFEAFFPHLSIAVARGDAEALKATYHRACQLMATLVMPPSVTLIFFAPELMMAWTRNLQTTDQTYLLVSILVFGYMCNGLVSIPYALQLAHGWTRFAFYLNLATLVVLVPLLLALVNMYQALGAALTWAALNLSYILIGIHFVHRRLLPTENGTWFWSDVGRPLLAATLPVVAMRLLVKWNPGLGRWPALGLLCVVGLLSLIATLSATRAGREILMRARGRRRDVEG